MFKNAWALLISLILFSTCIRTVENETDYSENRSFDSDRDLSIEDSRDELESGIGIDSYDYLVDSLGQGTLDLLVYDTGVSNLVELINYVISCGGTATKLVDLISSTVTSPNKIEANTVVGLLNYTDMHLRNEPVLPHGNDTIAKVANMVCKVETMDDLVHIVTNMGDYNGSGSPPETEAISRLGLVIALLNHNADNMPTIINEIADTAEGKTKLLRLVEEVTDLRDLAEIINAVDVLDNMITIVDMVDGTSPAPNGVDALIATTNGVDKPEDMAYFINQLSGVSNDINNDHGFESGSFTGTSWANAGHEIWTIDTSGSPAEGSFAAHTNPALSDLEISSLELAVNIMVAGNVTFQTKTDCESDDYLKFYIDDILQDTWSGTGGGWSNQSFALTTGVHRLRWEYVMDEGLEAGSNTVYLDNIVLPGDAGAARTAPEKIAIMLNQLDITAQNSVADIMNGLNTDTYGTSGLDNMVHTVNQVEYPLNISDEPRLVTIVNEITAVPTMTALIRDLDDTGNAALVEVLDHAPDVSQVADLVNEMNDAGLGSKMTDILNGVDMVGAYNVAKMVDGVDNTNLVTLIDNATTTSHMSTIFNNIFLHGAPGELTNGDYAGPTGGAKLTRFINIVDEPTNNLTITDHLVRLINDIAGSPQGPEAVGLILGMLDPQAETTDGVNRMVRLLDSAATQSLPNYDDPLDTATADEYGRIITLIKAMGGDGPNNIARIINELDCNDIDNTSDCRVYNAADIVKDSTRVVYVSRLISEMTNVDLVIELLNDPATDFNKVQTLLNSVGDDSYAGGTAPANLYNNPYDYPSVNEDYLGRLIMTINNVAGDQGITNIVGLVNGVNYVDGINDNFSILIDLIRDTHRVIYMTRLISDSTDLSLVIDLINEIDPSIQTEIDRLQNMVNEFGDNSYGTGFGTGTDPAPLYTDAMDTTTTDELGRMIEFINDLTAQVQATGSSQAQAISNVVTMIIDSYDLAFINDFIRGATRVRYITHLVAQIDNIGLMMTIINGETGDGSDGAELPKMLTLVNNYGGSTRLGANLSGKAVGEMTMFADVIDILGAGRPISDQAKITRLINEVIYCGIVPSSDLTITGAGTPSDFFGCDSHVDYDYDANKGTVAYDQRHRLSNMMLGLDDANAMAIIVGDVTDTSKTVRMVNGTRRINAVVKLVRWMPPEASRDLMNYTELDNIYSSLVYMTNNLAPDEDEAAQAFASLIHFGTGISHTQNRNDPANCHQFKALGPKRTAELLNIEPGAYLEGIIQMFGWRSSVGAMSCGFGTPNASDPQTVVGSLRTGTFDRVERLYANANQTGAILFTYDIFNASWCQSSSETNPSQIGYMPEESGALGYFEHSDTTVYSGFSTIAGSVPPGLDGIWQVLKGEGIIGWMLQNSGHMGLPPVDTAQYGNPECTDSGQNNEWDCIKVGKDSGDHISDNRWGNFCTIPGYNAPGSCESNGGRWMPDKNWSACYLNPETDPAVQ